MATYARRRTSTDGQLDVKKEPTDEDQTQPSVQQVGQEPTEEEQPTAQPPNLIKCRLDLIKELARGAVRFDPAQNNGALSSSGLHHQHS